MIFKLFIILNGPWLILQPATSITITFKAEHSDIFQSVIHQDQIQLIMSDQLNIAQTELDNTITIGCLSWAYEKASEVTIHFVTVSLDECKIFLFNPWKQITSPGNYVTDKVWLIHEPGQAADTDILNQGNAIIFLGGRDDTNSGRFVTSFVLKPKLLENKTCVPIPDIPTGVSQSTAVLAGNLLFHSGGKTGGSSILATHWMLDLSLPSPSWQSKSPLLEQSYMFTMVVTDSNTFYRFGGRNNDGANTGTWTKRVDQYDVANDQWTPLTGQDLTDPASGYSGGEFIPTRNEIWIAVHSGSGTLNLIMDVLDVSTNTMKPSGYIPNIYDIGITGKSPVFMSNLKAGAYNRVFVSTEYCENLYVANPDEPTILSWVKLEGIKGTGFRSAEIHLLAPGILGNLVVNSATQDKLSVSFFQPETQTFVQGYDLDYDERRIAGTLAIPAAVMNCA